jgi:hypothetical protein
MVDLQSVRLMTLYLVRLFYARQKILSDSELHVYEQLYRTNESEREQSRRGIYLTQRSHFSFITDRPTSHKKVHVHCRTEQALDFQ